MKHKSSRVLLWLGMCCILAFSPLYAGAERNLNDSERWLAHCGLNMLQIGAANISEAMIGLYTDNEQVKALAERCLDDIRNNNLQRVTLVFLNRASLMEGMPDFINRQETYGLAVNIVIRYLLQPYCYLGKTPKDVSFPVDIVYQFEQVTMIVSFGKNDKNIMSSGVITLSEAWDPEWMNDYGRWAKRIDMDLSQIGNGIANPPFLQVPETEDMESMIDDSLTDLVSAMKKALRNPQVIRNMPDDVKCYTGECKEVLNTKPYRMEIWSQLIDKINVAIDSDVVASFSQVCIGRQSMSTFVVASTIGTWIAYKKPADYSGDCVAVVRYTDSAGILVSYVERGGYVACTASMLVNVDFSKLQTDLSYFFGNRQDVMLSDN